MLDKLSSRDFAPYLNQEFRIHLDSSRMLEAELVDVAELGSTSKRQPASTERPAFSIVFRGPKDIVLAQRIYRLEHEEMGQLDLFLVPIGPDEEGMLYEALFA